ncbi:TetR/AcrR family transcriptional regulator [Cellulomonas fimi]|uniref:Regulatory protein TetR n=1 Tax=Cellulomonas fimi (strain ATCC 484 / DSM 20113 / JCM 1341 / CCUG 24087 / LMG 16345 / NBRC 15513 / NCIMB 8980 / NCTC 7547 / NRS-133) TaxID=590998 RepID=F4H0U0_CELFA|nr:TetR family transcriptional regulator [Cellulomonas fimi]AEE46187.1 regulatory protein TetR [Cellulomonas fimi ATCC 484]NNH07024.1 TetR family transcriptional regulator [Cellulomonas fimi]VEH31981.1 mycofactocin system transcriptional regulator [Cellulomonas fimi]
MPGPSTRDRLRAVALRLFLDHGFDATTVNQVAAEAGVSHMTFFRYFATKEDVVMDDPYDDVIVDAVRAQDPAMRAVDRVRLGITTAWAALPEPTADETRARVRLIAGHRGLMARAAENNRRTGELVADALVADGVDALEARVASAACLAALTEGLLQWGAASTGPTLGSLITRSLEVLGPEPVPAASAPDGGR